MVKSWTSPQVGDVVLLANGFEQVGQNTGQHYGLVIGLFKLPNNHTKILMIAPGTSCKPGASINKNTELFLPKSAGILGQDTKFYFTAELITIYEFPSDSFLESSRILPNQQSGQVSPVVGSVQNLNVLMGPIRNHYNDLPKFYKIVLKKWKIEFNAIVGVKKDKSADFLT